MPLFGPNIKKMKDQRNFEGLYSLLKETYHSPNVPQEVCAKLANMGVGGVATLIRCMRKSMGTVKSRNGVTYISEIAEAALENVKDPQCLELISVAALDKQNNQRIRRAAIWALGNYPEVQATTTLDRVRREEKIDNYLLALAIEIQIKRGKDVFSDLINELTDEHEAVRRAAFRSILVYGWEENRSDRNEFRTNAIARLQDAAKQKQVLETLVARATLHGGDPHAIDVLEKIGNPDVVQPLIALLHDLPDNLVRQKAEAALKTLISQHQGAIDQEALQKLASLEDPVFTRIVPTRQQATKVDYSELRRLAQDALHAQTEFTTG